MVERQTWRKLVTLRSDQEGEFTSQAFAEYCEELGIRREFSVPYTPQQNGAVEPKNRTVVEMWRCLLKSNGLPTYFWVKAVSTSVYLINHLPMQAVSNKTPYEVSYGRKPSVSQLKTFGCIALTLIPSQKYVKFHDKSKKCIFVGYSPKTKAYKFF